MTITNSLHYTSSKHKYSRFEFKLLNYLYFSKNNRAIKRNISRANLFQSKFRKESSRGFSTRFFTGSSWIDVSNRSTNRVLLSAERCVFAGLPRWLARNERQSRLDTEILRSSVRKPRAFMEILSVFALPCRDFGYARHGFRKKIVSRDKRVSHFWKRNAFDNNRGESKLRSIPPFASSLKGKIYFWKTY